ncbi:DUF2512 family protein [Brevibacillus sp. TJ4]|uniref:DUF2512 family protein n=1 Tax=Brevibacillus sp. TJ4 TaxID=3234853 RepID=UPI0037CDFD75
MNGFWIKLIATLLVVLLAYAWFPEVHFATFYQAIGVGIILALVGHWVDRAMLAPGRLWMTTAVDLVVGFLVVFASLFVLRNAQVTPLGAGFVAILFGVSEYVQHRWHVRNRSGEAA